MLGTTLASLPHVLCTFQAYSVMERVFKTRQNTNGEGSLSQQSLLVFSKHHLSGGYEGLEAPET